MAKCAYSNCGATLDVSFIRSGRRMYCSEKCCGIDQARRGYSVIQAGEGAQTAKAPVAPAKPTKPETDVDRWARGLERRLEEQRAAEKEIAARSDADRSQIDTNRRERAELDQLMRKYVSATYTDAELARLRELRTKHVF